MKLGEIQGQIYHNCCFTVCGGVFLGFVVTDCATDIVRKSVNIYCLFLIEVILHMIKFSCCFSTERKRNIKSII